MASVIWHCEPRERALLTELSLRYRMDVVEIANMARDQVLAAIDPIEANGEPYEWPAPREGDPEWMSLDWITEEIPRPDAQIDLLRAWDSYKNDKEICEYLLNRNPSLELLLKIYRNQVGWSRFWSVRARSPEERGFYATLTASGETKLQSREARLAAIKHKQRKLGMPKPEGA